MVKGVVIEELKIEDDERISRRNPRGGFREKWVPGFRSVFSSAVDVAGDWYFYYSIYGIPIQYLPVGSEDDAAAAAEDGLGKFEIPLLVICVFSTVFFLLSVIVYCMRAGNPKREVSVVNWIRNVVCCCRSDMDPETFLMLAEDFVEDVPQIVLTAMIISAKTGGITPAGMLNIATSIFNIVYNALQILDSAEEEQNQTPMSDGEAEA